jgi:hypothetical protein
VAAESTNQRCRRVGKPIAIRPGAHEERNLKAEGFRQVQYLPLPLEANRRVLPGAVQVSARRRGGVGGGRPGGGWRRWPPRRGHPP